MGEAEILKRRERRLWEANRNKLLFEYTQFTYYSKAVSICVVVHRISILLALTTNVRAVRIV